MPSDKPRIATYTSKENVQKFKIVSAYHNGKSMSEYLAELIEKAIKEHEETHGKINIEK